MGVHRLTPAMRGLLERIRKANRPPLHSLSPQEARRLYESAAEVLEPPRVPLPRVEALQVPVTPEHSCAARLYAPQTTAQATAAESGPLPVLLYLHGGGFTVGSLETHDSLCRQLALRSGAAVVALDYRLAPEHPFPAAVEDAWAALQWLIAHAEALGLDGSRVAVGGDSAGGTLAAVVALQARDAGVPLALQVLITPGTTAFADTPSHARYAEGFLLEKAGIEWFFNQYIEMQERTDWRFAPLLASEHDGVAPAWIGLAECDALVDEGIAYADTLRMAGVPVELEVYQGVTHDFIKMGRAIVEAGQAQDAIGQALRQAFANGSDS